MGCNMQSNLLQVVETRTGIAHAVVLAGSQKALADALGVSQQAVSEWETKGWVPLERATEIEALYGIPRVHLIDPKIVDTLEAPSFESVTESEGGEA